MKYLTEALTFDDVLIVPAKSSIRPSEANISTKLTKNIKLNVLMERTMRQCVLNSQALLVMLQILQTD